MLHVLLFVLHMENSRTQEHIVSYATFNKVLFCEFAWLSENIILYEGQNNEVSLTPNESEVQEYRFCRNDLYQTRFEPLYL